MRAFICIVVVVIFGFVPNNAAQLNSFCNQSDFQSFRIHTIADLHPEKQCEYWKAVGCFALSMEFSQDCLENMKRRFDKSEWDPNCEIEHTEPYYPHFTNCVESMIKNFTNQDRTKNVYILPSSFIPFMSHTTDFNKQIKNTFQSQHQECITSKIHACFHQIKCTLKSYSKVVHDTVSKCREEGLKNLNISNASSTFYEIPPTVEEFVNELGERRIGSLTNTYMSKLSQKTIEAFENFTYSELEAVKEAATLIISFKFVLCDPISKFRTNYDWKEDLNKQLSFANVSEKSKSIILRMSAEEILVIKDVINVNPHFQWFLCSSSLLLTPPPTFALTAIDNP